MHIADSFPLRRLPRVSLCAVVLSLTCAAGRAGELSLFPEPEQTTARGVQDNSFLLEEAYNQEPGVVQHIFNFAGFADDRGEADQRELQFAFIQEWPLWGQTHQFSYTVPASYVANSDSAGGLGDILINYRLQDLTESRTRPAIATRLSLVLPTGDENRGLGSGAAGFQTNTAISKIVADRWTVHGNAGLTWFPDVHDRALTSFNLGASAIYAVNRNFNLMLECRADWNQDLAADRSVENAVSILLSPGFRYAWNVPGNLQIVAGMAAPIGLTADAPDYGLFLYLSFEHPFTR